MTKSGATRAGSIQFTSQQTDFYRHQPRINSDVAMVQYSTLNSHTPMPYGHEDARHHTNNDKMHTGNDDELESHEEGKSSRHLSFRNDGSRRASADHTHSILLPGTGGKDDTQNIVTLNFEKTAYKHSRRNSTTYKHSAEASSIEAEMNIDEQTASIEKVQISPCK